MKKLWLFLSSSILIGCVSFPAHLTSPQALFCQTLPAHAFCGERRSTALGESQKAYLQDVNTLVNSQMMYEAEFDLTSDVNNLGGIALPNVDVWQSGTKVGDCEDFALTKYQLLYDAGYAPELLLLYKNGGSLLHSWAHAVIVVEAEGDEWILDNEVDEIYPYKDLSWSLRKKRL